MNQPTQVKALKEGKPADKPIYNHVTGLLDPPERIDSPQILIIEGLHPFFDDRVNDLVDFRIYLDISGGWCRVGCVGGGGRGGLRARAVRGAASLLTPPPPHSHTTHPPTHPPQTRPSLRGRSSATWPSAATRSSRSRPPSRRASPTLTPTSTPRRRRPT